MVLSVESIFTISMCKALHNNSAGKSDALLFRISGNEHVAPPPILLASPPVSSGGPGVGGAERGGGLAVEQHTVATPPAHLLLHRPAAGPARTRAHGQVELLVHVFV